MTKREKMHAYVLYNPNDETIMAERSESPSLSVKRFFFLSPAGSCRAPALPERSRAVPRCVFILSVSPSYRGTPPSPASVENIPQTSAVPFRLCRHNSKKAKRNRKTRLLAVYRPPRRITLYFRRWVKFSPGRIQTVSSTVTLVLINLNG